jgi:superfamily II DNA/RNA helicase
MKSALDILKKLGIKTLNAMQIAAKEAIESKHEVLLLSPTGTGKTLAFLLPLFAEIKEELQETQLLIVVPTRELAIQIEQVCVDMGAGLKVNAVYGGRAIKKDLAELSHQPHVLIGTPGRLADHLERKTIDPASIKFLVLDEFDKSLEIGFDEDMGFICDQLRSLKKKVLTSATYGVKIPQFVHFKKATELNFLNIQKSQLKELVVLTEHKDKLQALVKLIRSQGDTNGIVFCSFKNAIERVGDFLNKHNLTHSIFQGGLEQKERERALIKFRNGSTKILLATDLAARGLDIPDLDYIIHYHLPLTKEEYTHRNGRTARMNKGGTAYTLWYKDEALPKYMESLTSIPETELKVKSTNVNIMSTIFISGGRKDKISKGDIAGFFMKQGGLNKDELGLIELKTDCAFIGVSAKKSSDVIQKLNNQRLKKRKLRVYMIE